MNDVVFGHEAQVYIYPTPVLEVATMLLCHEGFSLHKAEAAPVPPGFGSGRRPRVTWHVSCPDQEAVENLVDAHKRTKEGVQIGIKQYERIRSTVVVRAMEEAWNSMSEGDNHD